MKKEITTEFNVVATLGLWFVGIMYIVATYDINQDNESTTLIGAIDNLALELLFFIIIWAAGTLTLSKLFKGVWNRLISDIFSLRQITLNEAYAFSIIMTWVIFA